MSPLDPGKYLRKYLTDCDHVIPAHSPKPNLQSLNQGGVYENVLGTKWSEISVF